MEQNKHLTTILKKMFSMVGAEYSDEFVKTETWFLSHSWTTKQEEKFRDWMINYLITHPDAQETMFQSSRVSTARYVQEKRAAYFLVCYGWTIKDD